VRNKRRALLTGLSVAISLFDVFAEVKIPQDDVAIFKQDRSGTVCIEECTRILSC